MLPSPLREFRRVDVAGDDRITVNLLYVISVAPDPVAADRAVIRITTGRGFEEYTVRGGYDAVRAILFPPSDGAPEPPSASPTPGGPLSGGRR